MYVTDAVNYRVQVFTEVGEFIGKFGDGELKFSGDVYIDENDILYVTEVDNYQVSMFRISDSARYAFHHTPIVSSPSSSLLLSLLYNQLLDLYMSLPFTLKISSYSYSPPTFLTTFGQRSVDKKLFYHGGIAVSKQGIV